MVLYINTPIVLGGLAVAICVLITSKYDIDTKQAEMEKKFEQMETKQQKMQNSIAVQYRDLLSVIEALQKGTK